MRPLLSRPTRLLAVGLLATSLALTACGAGSRTERG